MGPLSMSAKQHREYLKLQSQQEREVAKMQAEQQRKQELHAIKLQEAAAKANQGIGHKEQVNAVKLQELTSPLSKPPRINKQQLGIPTQNPMAGTGMFKQGQHKLQFKQGTDTVPAMLTPGEAVIPQPAAQNPKNKPIIKALVEEGRAKNRLRDGAVDVRYSDAPGQAKYHSNGTTKVVPSLAYRHPDEPGSSFVDGSVGIPSFNRGSAPQANYNDGTMAVPQQVQQAAGYFDGTEYAMYGDTGYGPLDVNLEVPQVDYPAVQVAADYTNQIEEDRKGIKRSGLDFLRLPAAAADIVTMPITGLANITEAGANAIGIPRLGRALGIYDPDVSSVKVPGSGSMTPFSDNLNKSYSELQPPVGASNTIAVPVKAVSPLDVPLVPYTNPNANQTATLKPITSIDQIDPYTLIKASESGNNLNAKNPLSSAAGAVQFTKDTWNGIRKQVPELANVEYGSKEFYSNEAQRAAFNYTNSQNEAILNKNGVPVNNISRYVMHGLGSGDGARVLSNPEGDFRETLNKSSRKGNADLIIKQNPAYAGFKTNQDYIDWAENTLTRRAGIGRDSSITLPKPINADPTQPPAIQVGTPIELRDAVPVPVLETSMVDSDPAGANLAIAAVAKQESTNLDRLIAAIKASDATPEVKQQEATTLIEKIYGDKGIFNQGDLIRFAITAAGGMLTGGSAAGSLRYASRDALMQSDARNRERIAAERQDKTINAQNARQDKSLLVQAAMQEARTLDAEGRADVKAARKDIETYTRELVKEGRDPTEVRRWISGGQKGNLPPIKSTFIRNGQNELVTVTQPFMFEGKRIDPGTPMYQYNLKDPRTNDIQTMVRIGTKDVPLESAVASGIMLNKWDEGRHGPKAQVEDLQKWSDSSSKRFGEMMKAELGSDDIKGRPNPARQGQVVPMDVQTQAASWALSKGYKINDPASKIELDKINSIATNQAINDMKAGSKVKDITPYLNASYIKQRSGLSDKLFELDPKKGTQMAPEKIVELRAKATNAGLKDDATMSSEMKRLSAVWNNNDNNIQRRYKDSASETGFYMFAADAFGRMSKNK